MVNQEIMMTIKSHLKAKGITYQDLAAEIGMSESGIKKLFTAKDISLKRLGQIADIIDVSLANIFQSVEDQEIKNIKFSLTQEDTLCKNPLLFKFFWFLVVDELSIDEIRKQEKLSQEQVDRFLIKLERMDLIRLGKSKRVLSTHKGLLRWSSEGPLMKKINQEWSETLLKKVLQKSTDDPLHRLSYLKLSRESQEEFYHRINVLLNEFARVSHREKSVLHKRNLLPISILMAVAKSRFV